MKSEGISFSPSFSLPLTYSLSSLSLSLSHTHILALSSLTAMHTKTDIHACSHPHIHTPQHTETRTRTYTHKHADIQTVDLCVFSFLKCHEPVLRTGIQSYTNSVLCTYRKRRKMQVPICLLSRLDCSLSIIYWPPCVQRGCRRIHEKEFILALVLLFFTSSNTLTERLHVNLPDGFICLLRSSFFRSWQKSHLLSAYLAFPATPTSPPSCLDEKCDGTEVTVVS